MKNSSSLCTLPLPCHKIPRLARSLTAPGSLQSFHNARGLFVTTPTFRLIKYTVDMAAVKHTRCLEQVYCTAQDLSLAVGLKLKLRRHKHAYMFACSKQARLPAPFKHAMQDSCHHQCHKSQASGCCKVLHVHLYMSDWEGMHIYTA